VNTGSGEENPAKIFKAEEKGSRLKLNLIIVIGNVAGMLSVIGKHFCNLNYFSMEAKAKLKGP
jgi:hypothetical protein